MGNAVGGWLERLALAGVLPGDDEEQRLRKATLTLTIVFTLVVAPLWSAFYWLAGLPVAALIPLIFEIAVGGSLAIFLQTKQISPARQIFHALILFIPFLLHRVL